MKALRWSIPLWTVALLALGSANAEAANPTVTLPAHYVTATNALLLGTVDTGGQRTLWQFQYGTSANYGSTTTARVIPAGKGNVLVAVRVGNLRPHRRYHFRLLSQYGQGNSIFYPIFVNFGGDRSFVTRVAGGNLGLGTTTLSFRGRFAPVSLYCAGRARCNAALRITRAVAGHPGRVQTLAKRSISLPGGATHTFSVKLYATALSLLNRNGNVLGASLTVRPPHNGPKLAAHITLIRP